MTCRQKQPLERRTTLLSDVEDEAESKSASAVVQSTDLMSAIKLQRDAQVLQMLRQSMDINGIDEIDENGDTALILAARMNKKVYVDRLLVKGANTNITNAHGVTALALAAMNGNLNMVSTLVQIGGAAVAAHDNLALFQAAKHEHIDVVAWLLAHGGDFPQAERLQELA